MKPLFTIHEGEFLVGDYINRRFAKTWEVWVPTKDSGVDLLVTHRTRNRQLKLQVKFSRCFGVLPEFTPAVLATSWYTLDPGKIRSSRADLWVLVILTLRHEVHFVVVPTRELTKRIPPGTKGKWNLYLWTYEDGSCFDVRGLRLAERRETLTRPIRNRKADYSRFLGSWSLLESATA